MILHIYVYYCKLLCLFEKFGIMYHIFISAWNYINYFVLVHWINFILHATRIFWGISKGEKSGQSNAKKVYAKSTKKKDEERQKETKLPYLVWNGVGRMNSDETQRQAIARATVARETKEILKDCHGNRCFGNRVLKAYWESALQREKERRRCDREGWKRSGRSDSGEEDDGPKETTLTFGCHISLRDSNRSHGSNFLGWTWELGGKRQLRFVPSTTLSRILRISSRDIKSVILQSRLTLREFCRTSKFDTYSVTRKFLFSQTQLIDNTYLQEDFLTYYNRNYMNIL